MSKSKQMRISNTHYDILCKMAKDLGVSRSEVINNAISMMKFLLENKAKSVKAVCSDGEKELFLSILLGKSQ